MSGQTFRWRRTSEANVFAGPVKRSLVLLKELKDDTLFAVPAGEHKKKPEHARDELSMLFDFDTDLGSLYDDWSAKDERIREIAPHLCGIRLLNQCPYENTFAFICSSNNNIKRITLMVDYLSKQGDFIGEYEGVNYHVWPTLSQLGDLTEEDLRANGFGYRAKFITKAVHMLLNEKDANWLPSLASEDTDTVNKMLQELPGVGRKVASCISLMSLGKFDSIPCDTHVLQIAIRDYGMTVPVTKTLTDRVANQVGEIFRKKFGEYAGYAQTILFVADVPDFKRLLPEELQRDAFTLKPSDLKTSSRMEGKRKANAKGASMKKKKGKGIKKRKTKQ